MINIGRQRRNAELGLGFLAVVVTIGGYVVLALANGPTLPPDLGALLVGIVGLYVIAHIAVRRLAPRAVGTLLPLAAVLNGLGFVTIARLDRDLARIQSIWSAVGVGAFVLTLLLVRNIRNLERYTYTFAFVALALLLVPLVPGLGVTFNGARIWAHLGPLHFQPGEPAKVLWVAFFAGYLTQKRELLSEGSRSIGRLRLPAARHLGPLIVTWGVSILVLVFEKDLGSSLLFFGVFAAMLYMATERSAYLIGSLALFSAGATAGYHMFAHVRDRVQGWLNPWPYRLDVEGVPDHPVVVRVRRRRRLRQGPRPRRARPDPATRRATSSSPPSVKSSACSARSRSSRASCSSSGAGSASRSSRRVRSRSCSRPA